MTLFSNIPGRENFRNPAITIGNFDGVHLGHQKIIHSLVDKAREMKGDAIVVTFESHPKKVLNPEEAPKILTTNREKIALLTGMGVNHVILLNFSQEMANLNAVDFYERLLIRKLGVREIVIGYDHAFGRNREGTIEFLNDLTADTGIGVKRIDEKIIDGRAISSTWLRAEIINGNFPAANRLLGRPYSLTGTVVRGAGRGKGLGFPTANVEPDDRDKLIPARGVYAVRVDIPGGERKSGMLNIGVNPTFGGIRESIEVNIPDLDMDLYGRELTLHFYEKIREEKRFSGPDELKRQITADRQRVLEILKDRH
jgi:riboflavin kinase/FMN adenylyltransferase